MSLNPRPKRHVILFRASDLASLNATVPTDYDEAVQKLGYFALLDDGKFAFYNSITKLFELLPTGGAIPALALEDLTNVSTSSLNPGDVLYWTGTFWSNTPITSNMLPASSKGHYSMNGNTTATIIAAIGTFYKIAGITTGHSAVQDFTFINNRATYTGLVAKDFEIKISLGAKEGPNKKLAFRIAKNGSTIPLSENTATTHSVGEAVNIYIQDIVTLNTGEYIEVFCANMDVVTNITVEQLNLIVKEF
jgi:hypothetical protein